MRFRDSSKTVVEDTSYFGKFFLKNEIPKKVPIALLSPAFLLKLFSSKSTSCRDGPLLSKKALLKQYQAEELHLFFGRAGVVFSYSR